MRAHESRLSKEQEGNLFSKLKRNLLYVSYTLIYLKNPEVRLAM